MQYFLCLVFLHLKIILITLSAQIHLLKYFDEDTGIRRIAQFGTSLWPIGY